MNDAATATAEYEAEMLRLPTMFGSSDVPIAAVVYCVSTIHRDGTSGERRTKRIGSTGIVAGGREAVIRAAIRLAERHRAGKDIVKLELAEPAS